MRPTFCIPFIAILLLPVAALGQERPVKMKDLPPAVQKTVTEQSKGAKLRGLSTEVENGKTEYEAELIVDGHSRDVSMNADGEVIEVEEQVELASLPDVVQTALKKQAGKGRITKVESVNQTGKLVFYEAQVRTGTKHREIRIKPDGQPAKGEQ
ncbi:MAG: hypothetical protein ACREDR_42930 [Blastocatellia bacterium]